MLKQEFIERVESVHGKNKYDFSKVPEKVLLSNKILIICNKHNILFEVTGSGLLNKSFRGCV